MKKSVDWSLYGRLMKTTQVERNPKWFLARVWRLWRSEIGYRSDKVRACFPAVTRAPEKLRRDGGRRGTQQMIHQLPSSTHGKILIGEKYSENCKCCPSGRMRAWGLEEPRWKAGEEAAARERGSKPYICLPRHIVQDKFVRILAKNHPLFVQGSHMTSCS